MVEPSRADPERVGSEVSVGGWLVTEVATDQTDVVPSSLVLVVRTVRNLPASAATWVYELAVASVIREHWLGSVATAEATWLVQLNHW